jgi:rhodanese-related sulfurtransferase
MTKEEFVKEVTNGLLPPPQYFPLNVKMNKEGYTDIDEILENGTKPLTPEDFEVIANETNALILDVRHQDDFTKGHIPKSIFIGIDGGFAPWVGAMIGNVKQPILLVTPKGREKETITRLSRVGFDQTLGYLNHGIEAWSKAGNAIDTIDGIEVTDLKALKKQKVLNIFDVRKPGEYASEHLDEAHSTPLSFINDYMDEFPKNEPFYLHCAGGYRSVIAASILKSRGIHNLIDVKKGFAAIKNEGMKISEYVCPSKL